MEDLPVRVGSMMSKEDMERILYVCAKNKASDIFFPSNDYVFARWGSRLQKVTDRATNDVELPSVLGHMFGAQLTSQLGGANPVDESYEITSKYDGLSSTGTYERWKYRFRVNMVFGLRQGRNQAITATFRVITSEPPTVESLGLEPEIVNLCSNIDQGLVLVVGATGNGKSTTLAAIVRNILENKHRSTNLVTVEWPIEFTYDGLDVGDSFVTQMQVQRHVKTFADGVRCTLRMAPTHILIGETRDLETVNATMHASMSGHTCFSTAHCNSVAETMVRLVSWFDPSERTKALSELLDVLKLVVAQRLVPAIGGGRVACREILVFDEPVKAAIRVSQGVELSRVVTQLVNERGRSMTAHAKQYLEQGRISQEEFERLRFNYEGV